MNKESFCTVIQDSSCNHAGYQTEDHLDPYIFIMGIQAYIDYSFNQFTYKGCARYWSQVSKLIRV